MESGDADDAAALSVSVGGRDEEVPRSATGGRLSPQARWAELAGEYGGQ